MKIYVQVKIILIIYNIACYLTSQLNLSVLSFDTMSLTFQKLNVSDELGIVRTAYKGQSGIAW